MAGKTGTTQVVKAQSKEELYAKCADKPYEYRHHGIFVAFAPYDNPKIAVAALVEHGCGSSAAAPIVEKVINTYMKKYLPETYEKNVILEKAQMSKYLKKRNDVIKKKKAEAEAEAEVQAAKTPEST
jgi:penicillin-binding protein 2